MLSIVIEAPWVAVKMPDPPVEVRMPELVSVMVLAVPPVVVMTMQSPANRQLLVLLIFCGVT